MPKQKTHKGLKKRFKVSATGKVKHKKAFTGHLMSSKNANRRRKLSKSGYLNTTDANKVKAGLGKL